MVELGILVGSGFDLEYGGQKEIASALKSRGYFVKEVDEPWPRNEYVYFNGKYFFEKNGDLRNVFGNGGMIQKGEDFLLVSDAAIFYDNFSLEIRKEKIISNKEDYEKEKGIIVKKGEKEFGTRVHIVPSGQANGDIDMYTLLLPKNKILFFDNYFGRNSGKSYYNEIAEKEGFKFFELDGKESGTWYPLNSLVLPKGNQDLVVLDKNANL